MYPKEKWKNIITEYPVEVSFSFIFLFNMLLYRHYKQKFYNIENLVKKTTSIVERSFQGRFDLFHDDIKRIKQDFKDDLGEFRSDFHEQELRIKKLEKKIEQLEKKN